MSWTEGEFYRFYTDKEIKNVYKKIIDIVENKLKFKYEYTEFNDEKNLFFYKNNKILNCNMKLNSIQIYNFINFFKKDIQGGSII